MIVSKTTVQWKEHFHELRCASTITACIRIQPFQPKKSEYSGVFH